MRIVAFIAMLLISSSVFAVNWIPVAASDQMDFYVDAGSIRNVNGIRRYWVLQNYLKKQSVGVFSTISLKESDCAQGRSRALQTTAYPQQNGGGNSLGTDNEINWVYVVPNSVGADVESFVCSH